MQSAFSPRLMLRLLFQPNIVFSQELAELKPSSIAVFFKVALWFGVLPPLFAYIGASKFGWRLGTVEPLSLQKEILLSISVAYFIALLFGFFSAAIVSRWMAIHMELDNHLESILQ